MKDTICVAVGLAGGFFTAIFGGWHSGRCVLVLLRYGRGWGKAGG